MTLTIPTLLAVLGSALMTLAIFAPKRPSPVLAMPLAHIERARQSSHANHSQCLTPPTRWTLLVDPTERDLGVNARIALITALCALDAPWAWEILLRARLEESDPLVRAALEEGSHAYAGCVRS